MGRQRDIPDPVEAGLPPIGHLVAVDAIARSFSEPSMPVRRTTYARAKFLRNIHYKHKAFQPRIGFQIT
jgi:hypothetical protein